MRPDRLGLDPGMARQASRRWRNLRVNSVGDTTVENRRVAGTQRILRFLVDRPDESHSIEEIEPAVGFDGVRAACEALAARSNAAELPDKTWKITTEGLSKAGRGDAILRRLLGETDAPA